MIQTMSELERCSGPDAAIGIYRQVWESLIHTVILFQIHVSIGLFRYVLTCSYLVLRFIKLLFQLVLEYLALVSEASVPSYSYATSPSQSSSTYTCTLCQYLMYTYRINLLQKQQFCLTLTAHSVEPRPQLTTAGKHPAPAQLFSVNCLVVSL